MSFVAWAEWKNLCAYARCSAESREALGAALQASFRKALKNLFRATGIPPDLDRLLKDTDESRQCIWSVFEEHFTGPSGKDPLLSRKDVMFEDILTSPEVMKAADAAAAEELASRKLAAYARNSMRDVVLAYAESAYSYKMRVRETSWDEVTHDGEFDRISNGADEPDRYLPPVMLAADEPWLKMTAEAVAAAVYKAASPRHRIAYAAKAMGISLAAAEVTAAADCGHDGVYKAFGQVAGMLESEARRQAQREDDEMVHEVTRRAALELVELVRNDHQIGKLAGR